MNNIVILNIIIWMLFGGLAGWLAGFIMGSRDGTLTNIVVGAIGAFSASFLMGFSNRFNAVGFSLNDLSIPIIGAAVLTVVFRVFKQS